MRVKFEVRKFNRFIAISI